jgi:ribA/ribD-fused uncharacterized protein
MAAPEERHIFFSRQKGDCGFCSQWFVSPFVARLSQVYATLGRAYPPPDGLHLEIASNAPAPATIPSPPPPSSSSSMPEDASASPAPHDPELAFACTEQWMMFCKAVLFDDAPTAGQILATASPAVHKRLGRGVARFDPARWDARKRAVVRDGNLCKFRQNAGLRRRLLAAGAAGGDGATVHFVEASPWDRIWGIGYAPDRALEHRAQWGENLLGKALDEVCAILAREAGGERGKVAAAVKAAE